MLAGVGVDTQVVKVGPISFPFSLNGRSPAHLEAKLQDIRTRHVCIASVDILDEYEIMGTLPCFQTIRLTLDEDADYNQLHYVQN